jgi:hypothetical protein
MSLEDLVLLSPTQLAGRVVTAHLVRQAIDGQAHDVAHARAPERAGVSWRGLISVQQASA